MIVGARMIRISRLTTIACACAALAAPRPAVAQTTTEFFGGYSYLRDPAQSVIAATAGDNALPVGWTAGAARPVWRFVAAVVDLSGHYKRGTTFDEDVRLSFHALGAGARASARIGPFSEFAQLLAGAAHARGAAFGQTVTSTALMLQPGGGVDYALGSRFAARLQLDWRWIRGTEDGRIAAHQLRAVAAVVYR
jgi:hypothetical protein